MKPIWIRLIGYFIVPLLLYLPFLQVSLTRDNYTGYFLHMHTSYEVLIVLLLALYFLFLFYLVGKRKGMTYWTSSILILACLFFFSYLIPYQENTIYAGIHLILAYAFFLWIQFLLFRLFRFHKHYVIIVGITLLCFFITLHFQAVNGLAEWIFASSISILLTYHYQS